MRQKIRLVERYLPLGFFLVLLLLLINAFITHHNLRRLASSYGEVSRTYRVINLVDNLFLGVQDAETSLRGFILTGRENYLEPYDKSLQTVPANLQALRAMPLSQQQQRRLHLLEKQVERRMKRITDSVSVRRTEGLEAALARGRSSIGKRYMDDIRRSVSAMRNSELALLDTRVARAQSTLRASLSSFWLATLASLALLFAFFQLVRRDLAGRIRYEAKLIAARDEAERANQAKSEFISSVSHELRTPLNAIIGFSKLLLNPRVGPLGEDQKAYTEDIVSSSEHLLQLINDILDLSKIEAGKMTLHVAPFDLSELMHQSMGVVREKAEANGIALEVVVPESVSAMPLLVADRRKVKQILYNLLSNAVKFTPAGGSVTLQAQRGLLAGAPAPQSDTAEFAADAAPFVTVAVRDSGVGILPENQKLIWNAFEQVDNSQARQFQGTGLGLALTKRMVELHGGTIWLESEVGQGSTFFFALPLRPAHSVLVANGDDEARQSLAPRAV